jgi:hypothetical protein
MKAQTSFSRSAGSTRAVEIQYRRSNFFGVLTIFVVVAAGGIAWALLDPSERSILWAVIGLVSLVVVVFQTRTVLDRTPVVVIDAIGIRDRRLGLPLIPWSRITSADVVNRVRASGSLYVGVRFHIEESPNGSDSFPYNVYIDMAPFDMTVKEFVEHVRHFAPHLPIDQSENNAAL